MTSKSNTSKERTIYLLTACHAYQQDQISSQQAKSTSQESNVQASDLQIQHIIEATSKDDALTLLKHTVNNGWPKSIPFWNLRK